MNNLKVFKIHVETFWDNEDKDYYIKDYDNINIINIASILSEYNFNKYKINKTYIDYGYTSEEEFIKDVKSRDFTYSNYYGWTITKIEIA